MFFYTDTPYREKGGPQIDVWKMNGTKQFIKHYEQKLFLRFVANNARSTLKEKLQAEHELTICERKLAFWRKHPNYDGTEAMRQVAELNKNWRIPA